MRSRIVPFVVGAVTWGCAACGGDDLVSPEPGRIRVATATTGSQPDPDGYTLTLDDGVPLSIGTTASLDLEVEAGEHTLELAGLASQCVLTGEARRTVTVAEDETVDVVYQIACETVDEGALTVVVLTGGPLPDPDGYTIRVDGGEPVPVEVNGSLVVAEPAPGEHSIELAGLALNCAVAGDNPLLVRTAADEPVTVTFQVGCRAGVQQWTPMNSGTPADFTSIWSSGDGGAVAVGERSTRTGLTGVVLGFDGTGWSRQYNEDDLRPRAVWGSAADDVYLVGYGFFAAAARVLHYDGTEWTTVPDIDREDVAGKGFESVWGSSARDVFVVGFEDIGAFRISLIYRFDGGGWLRMPVPGEVLPALNDVWGSSDSDVYAVGRDEMADPAGGVVLHYDGVTWGPVLQEERLTLNGVWGSSASDVFAVGFRVEERDEQFFVTGEVWHFDGTGWSAMDLPEVGVLNEVWGTSSSDVYVVGEDGLLLHYDGVEWTVTHQGSESLLGVWGGRPGEVLAVGINGTILSGLP
jgi:hypothetical protein